jgi:formaldehyde-activating enzyme involved in methanogenesis
VSGEGFEGLEREIAWLDTIGQRSPVARRFADRIAEALEGREELVAALARVRSACEREATSDGVFVERAVVLRAIDGAG